MTITYSEVLSAFQPAKEISDPRRFSGRRAQLIAGAQLLLAGDHIFIYGSRGIGKSSLARQLQLIASGKTELLQELDSPLASENFDFATCFIARDESINNVNQLLYRLTIDEGCFTKFPHIHEQFGLPAPYREMGSLDPDRVSDFWRRAVNIAKHHRNGLAIFVDEFELIKHHDGFASFLKAGRDKVIFVVTGIANTEKELVRDHQSIERQLSTGKLPLAEMTEDELRAVVTKAERSIKDEIRFTEQAKQELVPSVRGQPYLLHLIGRQSLIGAFTNKRSEIDLDDLRKALQYVAQNKTDSGLEDRYRRAIGHSPQRETVLREFAVACNPSAHTSSVYPNAEAQGVSNPSYYAGDLQKEQFGQELTKLNEQYYAFRDRLFQAYVIATPSRLSKHDTDTKTTGSGAASFVELLHLSDIHFGARHFFSNLPSSSDTIPAQDKPSFDRYICRLIEAENLQPAAILISGDVAQSGLTVEFNAASTALKTIADHADELTGRRPVLVTCPGNHDVNWEVIKSDPMAKYLAFQPYATFRNSLTTNSHFGPNVLPERLYEVALITGEPHILVLSLNSATIEGPSDHRGYIGESQLDNALREAASHPEWENSIRVAMFHHHLIPVSSIESRVASENMLTDSALVKRRLLSAGFSLVLHGHRHHGHMELVGDGTHSMVVAGCGSSGVCKDERGEQPLQFNRLILCRQRNSIDVQVISYNFDASDRRWSKSTSVPPKLFTLQMSTTG